MGMPKTWVKLQVAASLKIVMHHGSTELRHFGQTHVGLVAEPVGLLCASVGSSSFCSGHFCHSKHLGLLKMKTSSPVGQ